MKNQFAVAALSFVAVGSLSAQSLFDIAPDDSATESLPLKWTVGASVGYDDNPTPFGADNSSIYGQAYVGASFLNATPQSSFALGARAGVRHYFESFDGNGDETSFFGSLSANFNHNVSERLRFVSNNYIAYEREQDFNTGVGGAGQVGEYFQWYSDNAIGYRWTERFGTYTGFRVGGLDYEDSSISDRFTWSVYNNFRYQLTEQTVLTLNYRYEDVDSKGANSDSTRQYITAGVEHRLNPNTVLAAKAGVQLRDFDNAGSNDETSPYIEAAIRSKVNEAFSLNAYIRYSDDEYNRTINAFGARTATIYETSEAIRLGVRGSYRVSEPLTIHGGVSYYDTTFEDPFVGNAGDNVDESVINFNIGASLRVAEGIFVTGNYIYTDYSSDFDDREDDRNRFNLGVRAEF